MSGSSSGCLDFAAFGGALLLLGSPGFLLGLEEWGEGFGGAEPLGVVLGPHDG